MTYRKMIPAFIAITLVQTTLLSAFTVFGATANLPLCFFTLVMFLYEDEQKSLVVGIIFAIISDLTVSRVIGVYPLSMLIVGGLVIVLKRVLNYESKISAIIFGILAGVSTMITAILTALLGSKLSWMRLIKFTGVESLLNVLVILVMYIIMIRSVNKRPKRSRYERYEII